MSGDTSGDAERAKEAFMRRQDERDREIGPEGLREHARWLEHLPGPMAGLMARIVRERAAKLEAEEPPPA